MHRSPYVVVFRTQQRHELELALSELHAARIPAWRQEHSLTGPVTDASPFPAPAAAASYTLSVHRRELLKASAVLAQAMAEPCCCSEEEWEAPRPRFARYAALVVLTLLVLGLVRDFIATLRAIP